MQKSGCQDQIVYSLYRGTMIKYLQLIKRLRNKL